MTEDKERPERVEHHKVVVSNLTSKINDKHIKEIFGKFGKINYSDISEKKLGNGEISKKAYVSFATRADAEQAIKHMDKGIIDKAVIEVSFFTPLRRDRPPRGREYGQLRRRYSPKRRSPSPRRHERSPPRRYRSRSRSPIRRRSPPRRSISPDRERRSRRSPSYSPKRGRGSPTYSPRRSRSRSR
ncbi:hypothetical protein HDV06_005633 [Boothiomyces sp. JEL0866]|nr:hypothetical protein HDV06_005633 [Boothiomyces sp. JEL0866]